MCGSIKNCWIREPRNLGCVADCSARRSAIRHVYLRAACKLCRHDDKTGHSTRSKLFVSNCLQRQVSSSAVVSNLFSELLRSLKLALTRSAFQALLTASQEIAARAQGRRRGNCQSCWRIPVCQTVLSRCSSVEPTIFEGSSTA